MYIKIDVDVVAIILNTERETGCSEMSPLEKLKWFSRNYLGILTFRNLGWIKTETMA